MNRDKLARLSYFVTEVINAMHSGDDMDEEALQNACVTLVSSSLFAPGIQPSLKSASAD